MIPQSSDPTQPTQGVSASPANANSTSNSHANTTPTSILTPTLSQGVLESLSSIDRLSPFDTKEGSGGLSTEARELVSKTIAARSTFESCIKSFEKELSVGAYPFASIHTRRFRHKLMGLNHRFEQLLTSQDFQTTYRQLLKTLENILVGLERRLEKAIEPSSQEVSTVPLIQQQRQAQSNPGYMEVLSRIKQDFHSRGYEGLTCFICYAWPLGANEAKEIGDESWLQGFLVGLREDLSRAGVRTILDVMDNEKGQNIRRFMGQAKSSDKVLLVGSDSLRVKYEAGLSLVVVELVQMAEKRLQSHTLGQGPVVLPILLSGGMRNIPPEYRGGFSTIQDFQGQGDVLKAVPSELGGEYVLHVKRLLGALYGVHPSNVGYQSYWTALEVPLAFGSVSSYQSVLSSPSDSTVSNRNVPVSTPISSVAPSLSNPATPTSTNKGQERPFQYRDHRGLSGPRG